MSSADKLDTSDRPASRQPVHMLDEAEAVLDQLASLGEPQPFALPEFCPDHAEIPEQAQPRVPDSHASPDHNSVASLQLELRIEFGRAQLSRGLENELRPGTVVALDNQANQPVDLYAAGHLFGRGEVQVLDNHYCVRVTELL